MAFTVTVTQVDQQTYASVSRAVRGSEVTNLRPSTEGNLSSAAIFEKWSGTAWQTWYVSQTYASVLSSMTADEAESGAELQSNKVTSISGSSTDVEYPSAKLVYDQLALKEATANKATTFGTINDTKFPTVEAVVEVAQPIWYFAATGTDTYAATLTGIVPTAYYAGMQVKLLFGITNTGAATINLNGLGAKAITKGTDGVTALSASDLVITKIYTLIYDGTRFQINL